MTKIEIQQLINEQQSIILDRQAKLSASDYISAKIAEGKATKTEYSDKIAERQTWRDDINAAQQAVAELTTAMEAVVEEPVENEKVASSGNNDASSEEKVASSD